MTRGSSITCTFAALLAAAAVAAGCGSSDESSEDERLAGFARSIDAAYRCMPADTRRRYDRRAHRLEQIGAAILTRDRDLSPGQQDRALTGNREYVALTREVSRIFARYLPRGSEHDAACYRRELERHNRRARESGGE